LLLISFARLFHLNIHSSFFNLTCKYLTMDKTPAGAKHLAARTKFRALTLLLAARFGDKILAHTKHHASRHGKTNPTNYRVN
jgi:hypothetical protein